MIDGRGRSGGFAYLQSTATSEMALWLWPCWVHVRGGTRWTVAQIFDYKLNCVLQVAASPMFVKLTLVQRHLWRGVGCIRRKSGEMSVADYSAMLN